MKEKLRAKVEAALFMSNQPVDMETLVKMFKADKDEIEQVIDEMHGEFKKSEHGIYILETGSGLQLRVKPEYINSVGKLTPYKELSRGLLRVLALVAYKQPITQSWKMD